MKKCSECNVEMIENCTIHGQKNFEVGMDGRSHLSINIPTGEQTDFLGMKIDKTNRLRFKARVCPKCGKI